MGKHKKTVERLAKRSQKSKSKQKKKGIEFLQKYNFISTAEEPILKTHIRQYTAQKVGEMIKKSDLESDPLFFKSCISQIVEDTYVDHGLHEKTDIPHAVYASIKKQIRILKTSENKDSNEINDAIVPSDMEAKHNPRLWTEKRHKTQDERAAPMRSKIVPSKKQLDRQVYSQNWYTHGHVKPKEQNCPFPIDNQDWQQKYDKC